MTRHRDAPDGMKTARYAALSTPAPTMPVTASIGCESFERVALSILASVWKSTSKKKTVAGVPTTPAAAAAAPTAAAAAASRAAAEQQQPHGPAGRRPHRNAQQKHEGRGSRSGQQSAKARARKSQTRKAGAKTVGETEGRRHGGACCCNEQTNGLRNKGSLTCLVQ